MDEVNGVDGGHEEGEAGSQQAEQHQLPQQLHHWRHAPHRLAIGQRAVEVCAVILGAHQEQQEVQHHKHGQEEDLKHHAQLYKSEDRLVVWYLVVGDLDHIPRHGLDTSERGSKLTVDLCSGRPGYLGLVS